MRENPSLATLIESALGELSMRTISAAEYHNAPDPEGKIRARLRDLRNAINSAPIEIRSSPSIISKLQAILKSVEITCAPEFIVFLGRKFPKIMGEVAKDDLIGRRIRHIYRITEISSCFSNESLTKIQHGLNEVRKKVFELGSE